MCCAHCTTTASAVRRPVKEPHGQRWLPVRQGVGCCWQADRRLQDGPYRRRDSSGAPSQMSWYNHASVDRRSRHRVQASFGKRSRGAPQFYGGFCEATLGHRHRKVAGAGETGRPSRPARRMRRHALVITSCTASWSPVPRIVITPPAAGCTPEHRRTSFYHRPFGRTSVRRRGRWRRTDCRELPERPRYEACAGGRRQDSRVIER